MLDHCFDLSLDRMQVANTRLHEWAREYSTVAWEMANLDRMRVASVWSLARVLASISYALLTPSLMSWWEAFLIVAWVKANLDNMRIVSLWSLSVSIRAGYIHVANAWLNGPKSHNWLGKWHTVSICIKYQKSEGMLFYCLFKLHEIF